MMGGVGEAALAEAAVAATADLAAGGVGMSALGSTAAPSLFSSMVSGINPMSAGLSVGSSVMQGMAQKGVQDRQQKLADAMTAYRLSKSQQGQAAIGKFVDTLQPDATAADHTAAVNDLSTNLDQSINAARKYEVPGTIAGNTGADYANRLQSNNDTMAERLKRAISQLSIIGAPGQQQLTTAKRYGRAATDVDAANIASNNVSGAYQTGMQNQRPDPFLTLGSQIANGLGLATALKRPTLV